MDLPTIAFGAVKETLSTIIQYVNYFNKSYGNFVKDTSLTDVTKLTNVEPLTIVSKDLINLDYTKDVANTLLSLFSAYYLQSVAVLTVIDDVKVRNILDKLNPNRSIDQLLAMEAHPSVTLENYKYELPTKQSVALEVDKDDKKQLLEASNLALGKLLDVRIKLSETVTDKDGVETVINNDVTIPIAIRLLTTIVSNDTITNILTGKLEDKGLIERYHSWRAGRISFIRDLVLCQDLIDEHKRLAAKDESNIVQTITNRVLKAKSFGVLTGNPSLAISSNLFIISDAVAKEIEYKVGTTFKNLRNRKKIFEGTYAMIIAVVDREWERVTFYVRGIDEPTELSIKEIKAKSSGKDVDIADILKSFQLGMGANF